MGKCRGRGEEGHKVVMNGQHTSQVECFFTSHFLESDTQTYWQTWQVTSDCRPPVKIWSMMQLQWFGLLAFFPLSSPADRKEQRAWVHAQITPAASLAPPPVLFPTLPSPCSGASLTLCRPSGFSKANRNKPCCGSVVSPSLHCSGAYWHSSRCLLACCPFGTHYCQSPSVRVQGSKEPCSINLKYKIPRLAVAEFQAFSENDQTSSVNPPNLQISLLYMRRTHWGWYFDCMCSLLMVSPLQCLCSTSNAAMRNSWASCCS